MSWDLRLGSCLDPLTGLASLADSSVDALVTDPPAGIGFMGKEWDSDKGGRDQWIAWLSSVMVECLRVLKPGAHGLVWALPRTSHWTATACEDAGFEIRDVHHHLFGTGFPKSLTSNSAKIPEWAGTALKPAAEHWILVRKPLEASVAETFAEHGTGVLNIGGCRISGGARPNIEMDRGRLTGNTYQGGLDGAFCGSKANGETSLGRWPAHVSFAHSFACWRTGPDGYLCPVCGEVRQSGKCDRCSTVRGQCAAGCPVHVVDEQSGATASKRAPRGKAMGYSDDGANRKHDHVDDAGRGHNDTGGASRFFFVTKGSRSEKDAGLESMRARSGGEATGRADGSAGTNNPRAGSGRTGGARNFHPTVKSVDLMRWLVRLVTPPGGLVLDAFAGSGTTGVACIEEGMRFVGFELSAEYTEIARARLANASRQLTLFPVAPVAAPEPRPEQPGLFDALACPLPHPTAPDRSQAGCEPSTRHKRAGRVR